MGFNSEKITPAVLLDRAVEADARSGGGGGIMVELGALQISASASLE